ncbi:hypothetical protein GN244_ATG10180 [Phytophthora infestans]|uniref:Uncharacterized protein n=1 Tax=Phytophthora infestans TaxID=4787 RepID=A0A833ST73_PHYIN|nr:hypothetical protein GN244_ATG10180 [Phytophthora infestans]
MGMNISTQSKWKQLGDLAPRVGRGLRAACGQLESAADSVHEMRRQGRADSPGPHVQRCMLTPNIC